MSEQKRKVLLYIATSLDGYIATEDDSLDWLFQIEGQEEANKVIEEFDQTIDTLIMGRRTFEWVMDETDGRNPYPHKKTYVYTHQPRESSEKIQYTQMQPVELVDTLRKEAGKDICLMGGGGIILDFLEADLVDEMILTIAPVLLGRGIPLFKEGDYASQWGLKSTRQFGQFVELRWERK